MSLKYDDFDLQITPAGDKYRVHLNGPTGQASAEFVLPFTDVDLGNFLGRIGQVRSTRRSDAPELHAAKEFGSKLFSAVFSGELIAQLRGSVEQSLNNDRGLRIRLRLTDAPALADLPWEFLYDAAQNHFLTTSTETPLVRFLDLPQRIAPLRATLPLRILVVIASPRNLKRLDAEGEWERLQDALADLLRAGHIVLERLPVATLDALRLRARGVPFHIFHFIGHGGFDSIAEDGVLQFEDEKGMSHPVRGELLGMQLHDHRSLRLAVLNACEGARSSRQDPFSGVAQSLLQQRVPAVIAMQFEISDAAAKVFAREFYCAIAEGNPVDAAVCESRKALFNEEFGQEWATPVLYMRSHEGLLFDLQAPSTGVPESKSGEHERVEAEHHAAELADLERAAAAEKERQAHDKAEQERIAREREEAQRRAAEKAEAERLAAAASQRQAIERAEHERIEHERVGREKKEAERRAAEKEEAERAVEAERERQARENAERERLRRERTAKENAAREAAASEVAASLREATPAPSRGTTPAPNPRPAFPPWQILLMVLPLVALIAALSWHHLRPHHDDVQSAESHAASPSSASENTPAELPPTQKSPDVAGPTRDIAAPTRSKKAATRASSNRSNAQPETSSPGAAEKESNVEKPIPAPQPKRPAASAPPSPLRVNSLAQAEKLVKGVSPVYPPLAAQGHVSGAVELEVIIAKDGTVKNVIVKSGNPLLAQSAVDAVKQRVYSPTLVNGSPIEVETTVEVNYTLRETPAPAASATLTPGAANASGTSTAPPPQAKQAPCTLGRVDFQEAGTMLVGTVPFSYTGNSQLQTLAIWGIPLTADEKKIAGVTLAQTTLQTPSGTASFSMESHPSLSHTGPVGEYVLVAVAVKGTGQIVCNKLVPYHRIW